MVDRFLAVTLASFIACGVTAFGIWVISKNQEWARKRSVYLKSFAAGMLIAMAFMHLVPKSFQMRSTAPIFLLVGFLAIYVLDQLLDLYICQDDWCVDYSASIVPALGIGFHSFIDGIIYSVTFNVSIFTGILAAAGMILHEFPEGIITFVVLERGGFGRQKSTIYAFLAAALSTPLGTLVSYPFIHRVEEPMLGTLLALSAGALLYVGASHLLPSVKKEGRGDSMLTLAAGVLVAVLIILFKK